MPYDYSCTKIPQHPAKHCKRCQKADCDKVLSGHLSAAHGAGDDEPKTVHRTFLSQVAVSDWAKYFAGWSPTLKYAVVFTHQRPRCTFKAPPPSSAPAGSYSCELGDVLIVLTDNIASRRKAGLLQAKMAAGWPPGGKKDQWYLYTGWPDITYNPNSSSPASTSVTRSMPFSGGPSPSAQYLSLDLPAASAETNEAVSVPSPQSFSEFLDDFLNGSAGMTFSWDRKSAVDGWDQLVWDLLDYTWHQATGTSASHGTMADRGQGVYFASPSDLALVQKIHSLPENGREIPPPWDFINLNERPGWGVPVVHLIRGEATPE